MSAFSKTLFLESYRQANNYYCTGCQNDAHKFAFDLPMCNACRSVSYCSRECQKADWPAHKSVCKVITAISIQKEIYVEPSANALQPLVDGSCSHFPLIMAARNIPRETNVVYIIWSESTPYANSIKQIGNHICNDAACECFAVGYVSLFARRLPGRRFGYLHTDKEIQANFLLHQDVRRLVAKIFDLGVPNTRVMIHCARNGAKTSVFAGTKELEWPKDELFAMPPHVRRENTTDTLLSFLANRGFRPVTQADAKSTCNLCNGSVTAEDIMVAAENVPEDPTGREELVRHLNAFTQFACCKHSFIFKL